MISKPQLFKLAGLPVPEELTKLKGHDDEEHDSGDKEVQGNRNGIVPMARGGSDVPVCRARLVSVCCVQCFMKHFCGYAACHIKSVLITYACVRIFCFICRMFILPIVIFHVHMLNH